VASGALYGPFLDGKKQFATRTVLNLLQQIARVILMLLAIWWSDNALLIIFAYFFSDAVLAIAMYIWTQRFTTENSKEDPQLIKNATHFSAMDVLVRISDNVDSILLFHYLGATQVAIFSFAIAPTREIRGINKILRPLILPRFSVRSIWSIHNMMFRKFTLYFLFAITITATYIIIAPYFFSFLFPQYLEAIPYSQIFALTLLTLPVVLFEQVLVAHLQTRQLYISKVSTALIKLGLAAAVIPFYGLWGAIIINTAIHGISMATYFILYLRLARSSTMPDSSGAISE
jgi:O-antigen/teichoic acid export membrane protein